MEEICGYDIRGCIRETKNYNTISCNSATCRLCKIKTREERGRANPGKGLYISQAREEKTSGQCGKEVQVCEIRDHHDIIGTLRILERPPCFGYTFYPNLLSCEKYIWVFFSSLCLTGLYGQSPPSSADAG